MLAVLSGLADVEHDLIRTRTGEGRSWPRSSGAKRSNYGVRREVLLREAMQQNSVARVRRCSPTPHSGPTGPLFSRAIPGFWGYRPSTPCVLALQVEARVGKY